MEMNWKRLSVRRRWPAFKQRKPGKQTQEAATPRHQRRHAGHRRYSLTRPCVPPQHPSAFLSILQHPSASINLLPDAQGCLRILAGLFMGGSKLERAVVRARACVCVCVSVWVCTCVLIDKCQPAAWSYSIFILSFFGLIGPDRRININNPSVIYPFVMQMSPTPIHNFSFFLSVHLVSFFLSFLFLEGRTVSPWPSIRFSWRMEALPGWHCCRIGVVYSLVMQMSSALHSVIRPTVVPTHPCLRIETFHCAPSVGESAEFSPDSSSLCKWGHQLFSSLPLPRLLLPCTGKLSIEGRR